MTHGLAFPHPFGERLKEAKRKVQWLGAIMIVLGVIALVFPVFSTLTITYFIAFMLITFGVVSLNAAFLMIGAGPFFAGLLFSLASIGAGVFMLFNPAPGAAALTVLVGGLFLTQGAYELVLGFEAPASVRAPILISALITLVLAFAILAGWPQSSAVVLGVMFGVNFISSGVGLALAARD